VAIQRESDRKWNCVFCDDVFQGLYIGKMLNVSFFVMRVWEGNIEGNWC
jgi:hypothetical protein